MKFPGFSSDGIKGGWILCGASINHALMHVPPGSIPPKHTPFCALWFNTLWSCFHPGLPEQSPLCQPCSWAESDSWGPEHSPKAQTQPGSSNCTAWAPLWQSVHLPKPALDSRHPSEGTLGRAHGLTREDVSFSLSVPFWWEEEVQTPPFPRACLLNSPCCHSGVGGEEVGWSHSEMQKKIQNPLTVHTTQTFSSFCVLWPRHLGKHPHAENVLLLRRTRTVLDYEGKYYRDFVGVFFFSPWKDIIPNVVICGLAPTSILQWLLQSEPPFRPV